MTVKTRRTKYSRKFIQTRVAYTLLFLCMDETPAGPTKESSIYSCKDSVTHQTTSTCACNVRQWLAKHPL